MFEDSLVESTGRCKTKKGWTTLLSLGVELAVLGVMVIVPLIYTEALPSHALSNMLLAPASPHPPGARQPAPHPAANRAASQVIDLQYRQPARIPQTIAMNTTETAPSPDPGSSVEGSTWADAGPGGNNIAGLNKLMGDRIAPPLPPVIARPERPKKLLVSEGVLEGYVIEQRKPPYPAIAKMAGISGAVVLQATISPSGLIENIRTVSGPPLLIPAALDAVRTWRYRPYMLNGTPVEVETQITVRFSLGRD